MWQTHALLVVLDTNILISACWTPGGLEDRTVRLVLDGSVVSCASNAIWEEYREVLGRKKFASKALEIEAMLDRFAHCTLLFAPGQVVNAAQDETDNRFLECAEAAGANYLVTGNLRHYPTVWKTARIVNAREFLNCWCEETATPFR